MKIIVKEDREDFSKEELKNLGVEGKLQVFKKGIKKGSKPRWLAKTIFGEPMAGGAYREVWEIDSHRVLKVGDHTENEKEADLYFQNNITEILPKVYDAGENYKWILVEKTTPVTSYYEKSGSEVVVDSFPKVWEVFSETFDNGMYHDFVTFLKAFVQILRTWRYISGDKKGRQREKFKKHILRRVNQMLDAAIPLEVTEPEEKEKYLKDLIETIRSFKVKDTSQRFQELIDVVTIIGSSLAEIFAVKNMGVDDEGKMVILDISAFNDPYLKLKRESESKMGIKILITEDTAVVGKGNPKKDDGEEEDGIGSVPTRSGLKSKITNLDQAAGILGEAAGKLQAIGKKSGSEKIYKLGKALAKLTNFTKNADNKKEVAAISNALERVIDKIPPEVKDEAGLVALVPTLGFLNDVGGEEQ